MSTLTFQISLFALVLLLCTCTNASIASNQKQGEMDTLLVRELRNYDTVGVETALLEWRLDSMGCMKLRTVGMADYLVQQLGIVGKTVNEATVLLGNPNESRTYKDWFGNREDDFLFITYYIAIPCIDGKPVARGLDHCWLRLQVDLQTKRVLAAIAPCS